MTGNMSNKFLSTLSTPMYRVDSVDSVDKGPGTPRRAIDEADVSLKCRIFRSVKQKNV